MQAQNRETSISAYSDNSSLIGDKQNVQETEGMESRFGGYDENEKNDSIMLESPPSTKNNSLKNFKTQDIIDQQKLGRSTVKEPAKTSVVNADDTIDNDSLMYEDKVFEDAINKTNREKSIESSQANKFN